MPSAPCSVEQLAVLIARHRAEFGDGARVCFLLQPGGAACAYQAGAIMALAGRGVTPDLVVGSSGGALNGLGLMLDALAPAPLGARSHTRLARLWRRLGHRGEGAALVVDKPCLIDWMSGKPDWNRRLLGGLVAHAGRLGEDFEALSGGMFELGPLKAFLTRAIARSFGEPSHAPERAGRALVEAWARLEAAGRKPPTFISVATRVGTHAAVPFVLGDPEVAHRLFDARWPVAMLGHEALVGEAVVDALIASCAIPALFPAVALPMPGVSEPFRTFVDGAIANSEPFHLAIDAGATLIVSLEVSSRRSGPPTHAALAFPALAAESFLAVQDRYYASELRELARWNARADDGSAPEKRKVSVFRLAPHRREIGVLDFDGRWEEGRLVCSLYDWVMAGYADAGGRQAAVWADYEQGRERHGDAGWALTPRAHNGFDDATYPRRAPAPAPSEPSHPLPVRAGA